MNDKRAMVCFGVVVLGIIWPDVELKTRLIGTTLGVAGTMAVDWVADHING